jgi:hypothetical protein
MRPLTAMNNVQKARLLHALLLQEIPQFLNYTMEVCIYIANNTQAIAENWKDQLFGVDFWVELSKDTHFKIEQYGRELEHSSVVFAEQLFDGYGAIFMNHLLLQYTAAGRHTDPKFKQAVDLLFT